MTTTRTPAPIHPGHHLPHPVPGTGLVVTLWNLSRRGATVWRIETTGVAGLITAYTRSYDSEATARAEARRLCHAFAAGQTPRTLDEGPQPAATIVEPKPQPSGRPYNEVARELDWEQRRTGKMRNGNRIAELTAELDTIPFPNAA